MNKKDLTKQRFSQFIKKKQPGLHFFLSPVTMETHIMQQHLHHFELMEKQNAAPMHFFPHKSRKKNHILRKSERRSLIQPHLVKSCSYNVMH